MSARTRQPGTFRCRPWLWRYQQRSIVSGSWQQDGAPSLPSSARRSPQDAGLPRVQRDPSRQAVAMPHARRSCAREFASVGASSAPALAWRPPGLWRPQAPKLMSRHRQRRIGSGRYGAPFTGVHGRFLPVLNVGTAPLKVTTREPCHVRARRAQVNAPSKRQVPSQWERARGISALPREYSPRAPTCPPTAAAPGLIHARTCRYDCCPSRDGHLEGAQLLVPGSHRVRKRRGRGGRGHTRAGSLVPGMRGLR
jgi:hypothetical protein